MGQHRKTAPFVDDGALAQLLADLDRGCQSARMVQRTCFGPQIDIRDENSMKTGSSTAKYRRL